MEEPKCCIGCEHNIPEQEKELPGSCYMFREKRAGCKINSKLVMTPEQIKNWRNILCGMLGPYALIMPEEDIIKMKDNFQKRVNKMETRQVGGQNA